MKAREGVAVILVEFPLFVLLKYYAWKNALIVREYVLLFWRLGFSSCGQSQNKRPFLGDDVNDKFESITVVHGYCHRVNLWSKFSSFYAVD